MILRIALLSAVLFPSAAFADEPLYAFTEFELRQIGVLGFDEWKYQQGYGDKPRETAIGSTTFFMPPRKWPEGQRRVTKWLMVVPKLTPASQTGKQ